MPLTNPPMGVTVGGNTAGAATLVSSGTLTLAGGNNITLSQSGNAITISGGAAGGGFSAGVSTGGNTSNASGVVGSQLVLAGGNNVTLSQSVNGASATVTISAASQTLQTSNVHNLTLGGNTAGVMAQVSSGTLTLAGGNNVTLSQNGNAVTISGAPPPAKYFHEIIEGERLTTAVNVAGASFSKRPIIVPFWMDGDALSVNTVRLMNSRTAGTSLNFTLGVGFYSLNATNATRLTLAASTTNAFSLTTSAQWSGIRAFDVTGLGTFTMSEGHWFMALFFSAITDNTAVMNMQLLGADQPLAMAGFVLPGTNSTAASAGSSLLVPYWGVYSNTTGAFPAVIGASDMLGGGGAGQAADVYAVLKEI